MEQEDQFFFSRFPCDKCTEMHCDALEAHCAKVGTETWGPSISRQPLRGFRLSYFAACEPGFGRKTAPAQGAH